MANKSRYKQQLPSQRCGSTESKSLWSTHEREVKVSKDFLLLCSEDAGCSWEGEYWLEASELLIKVTDVLRRPDDRQEGRLHLFGQESVPVHFLLTDNGLMNELL